MDQAAATALLDAASDENGVALIDGVGVKYYRWYGPADDAIEITYIFAGTPIWQKIIEGNRFNMDELRWRVTDNGKVYGQRYRSSTA